MNCGNLTWTARAKGLSELGLDLNTLCGYL